MVRETYRKKKKARISVAKMAASTNIKISGEKYRQSAK